MKKTLYNASVNTEISCFDLIVDMECVMEVRFVEWIIYMKSPT